MINTLDVEEARKLLRSAQKPILIRSQNPEFDRKILEYGKFDLLVLSLSNKKDSPKELNAGFNHVFAKIAAKNKVSLALDLQDIRSLDKKEKARTLARFQSVIEICKKENLQIKILNHYTEHGAKALLSYLGTSTQQSSKALAF